MLVLTRKLGEEIVIGKHVVQVVSTADNSVRLRIRHETGGEYEIQQATADRPPQLSFAGLPDPADVVRKTFVNGRDRSPAGNSD